ncbi:MAG: Na/Pi symporter [Candidatus Pacebacteria bacterium]|nr:Na/Pi symporter [Candidatus Paceibacterota bacterium]
MADADRHDNSSTVVRIATVLFLLYVFLLSITMMGSAFKLFGKGFATQLIQSCSNPFIGLFIGILSTSIIQSSSTTTSLIVGFVGGGALSVEVAIPMIMGANIGTSITNALVSLGFMTRREDFRRAFGGAIVHDFFNLLTVLVLLPLELVLHPIQRAATWLTDAFSNAGGITFTSPLKAIITPVAKALEGLFADTLGFGPGATGGLLLAVAVVALIASLVYLVKTMRLLIVEKAEQFVNRYLFRNDFTAFLLGICLTVLVQSSSVTTSLIVPLVGAGIVTLYRCYPFTLGANIGTTCTALLASLATVSVGADGAAITVGVTAAFAHLMFNVFGIAIFYPLRILPITLARRLADLATESKRWAIGFIFAVFIGVPALVIVAGRLLGSV